MKLSHLLLLFAAVTFGATGCHKAENDELAHHHHHHEAGHHNHGHDEHDGHDHEAEGVISLAPDMAARLGVTVDTAAVTDMPSVAKTSGVIEPSADATGSASAPTAGIITLAKGINQGAEVKAGQLIATVRADGVTGGDPNRAARADLDAARAELDRVKPLWEERLVTRAQYNQAVADYERARAAYSAPAAAGRVTAPVSGIITSLDVRQGQFVEAGASVAMISGPGALTLRADVPARLYSSLGDVNDARVVLPYSGKSFLISQAGGRRVGAAATAARGGYGPVTFTFSDQQVIPGTAVDVYLIGEGSRRAVTVPATAVVEQQGEYFVYVRLDEDCYSKLAVSPGASDGHLREITAGLRGGETIVATGTTAITLAAAAGNIPEGHSHSH